MDSKVINSRQNNAKNSRLIEKRWVKLDRRWLARSKAKRTKLKVLDGGVSEVITILDKMNIEFCIVAIL